LAERFAMHYMRLNLGHINALQKRPDRLTLYYNIFFKLEGSVLAYLVAQEEEEKEALK
jgi:hypothetical protein